MKTFVIHPDKLEERGIHMAKMLNDMSLCYEFVNEGHDEAQIDVFLKSFLRDGREKMLCRSSRSLCTISHFLAYQKILQENLDGALILEDDTVLYDSFKQLFEQSIEEYRQHYANQRVLISYEDSSLQFVPRSKRKKGQMLYPGSKDRMAGAYFINRHAAQAILDRLKKEQADVAIDVYHYQLIKEGFINYLWCQPALATQGSFTGAFRSSLSKKKDRMITFRWWFKKNYKKLLYNLR